jgi:hypothetical protein
MIDRAALIASAIENLRNNIRQRLRVDAVDQP